MTERLHDLLAREAGAVAVPPPAAHEVVRRGRGMRRRRRVATGVASVAALAVVGAGVAIAVDRTGAGPDRADDVTPAAALEGWAVAAGSTVHLGNGTTAKVDGTVKSVYYTSAGVLARTGRSAVTDENTSRYALVADDGTVTDFGLDLGDRVPSTDPGLPYFAYAEPTSDPRRWEVVLRDVRSGDVAHRVSVDGAFTWGGWVAPPVALSGEHVYLALDHATYDVNWRTGEVTRSDVLRRGYFPTVAGGRMLDDYATPVTVRDAQTGQLLRELTSADEISASLSPDGEHALISGYRVCDETGTCSWDEPTLDVYGVDTGSHVGFDTAGIHALGWTPSGWLIAVKDDAVDVCEPDTGDCRTTPIQVGGKEIRVGGSLYES